MIKADVWIYITPAELPENRGNLAHTAHGEFVGKNAYARTCELIEFLEKNINLPYGATNSHRIEIKVESRMPISMKILCKGDWYKFYLESGMTKFTLGWQRASSFTEYFRKTLHYDIDYNVRKRMYTPRSL